MSIKVRLKKIKKAVLDLVCPPATQDLALNTKNRDSTIKKFNYGPLNVDEPADYWQKIAKYWKTSEKAAKESSCGVCVAFDISPRMKDCLPGDTFDDDGELGYCWMHHFKCHSARSCHTWAKGGPIAKDSESEEWQEKNKNNIEERKRKKRKKSHHPTHKRSKKYFGGYFYDHHMLHGDSPGVSVGDGGDGGGGGDGNRSENPKTGTGKKPKGSGRRLYTDENPSDTVSVKFSTVQDVKDTLAKSSFKSKSHKRQSQIINLIHQRARAAYKNAKDPKVKARLKKAYEYAEERKEASKKKTQRLNKEKKK